MKSKSIGCCSQTNKSRLQVIPRGQVCEILLKISNPIYRFQQRFGNEKKLEFPQHSLNEHSRDEVSIGTAVADKI